MTQESISSRRFVWFCETCQRVFASQPYRPRGTLARGRSCYGTADAPHPRVYDMGRYQDGPKEYAEGTSSTPGGPPKPPDAA